LGTASLKLAVGEVELGLGIVSGALRWVGERLERVVFEEEEVSREFKMSSSSLYLSINRSHTCSFGVTSIEVFSTLGELARERVFREVLVFATFLTLGALNGGDFVFLMAAGIAVLSENRTEPALEVNPLVWRFGAFSPADATRLLVRLTFSAGAMMEDDGSEAGGVLSVLECVERRFKMSSSSSAFMVLVGVDLLTLVVDIFLESIEAAIGEILGCVSSETAFLNIGPVVVALAGNPFGFAASSCVAAVSGVDGDTEETETSFRLVLDLALKGEDAVCFGRALLRFRVGELRRWLEEAIEASGADLVLKKLGGENSSFLSLLLLGLTQTLKEWGASFKLSTSLSLFREHQSFQSSKMSKGCLSAMTSANFGIQ
jgi:hypothetical protein